MSFRGNLGIQKREQKLKDLEIDNILLLAPWIQIPTRPLIIEKFECP